MAQGGICVSGRTLPDRCRGPSRGNYFTGSGQHDVGWSRSDAGREVSEGKADRPENAHGAVRGRLHHHPPASDYLSCVFLEISMSDLVSKVGFGSVFLL